MTIGSYGRTGMSYFGWWARLGTGAVLQCDQSSCSAMSCVEQVDARQLTVGQAAQRHQVRRMGPAGGIQRDTDAELRSTRSGAPQDGSSDSSDDPVEPLQDSFGVVVPLFIVVAGACVQGQADGEEVVDDAVQHIQWYFDRIRCRPLCAGL